MRQVAILNTSIVTAHGSYEYTPLTLEEAIELAWLAKEEGDLVSAVGHDATAKILSELLKISVPTNRIEFRQAPKQTAIVFKLRGRPPEGKILSVEEIEEIGYDFGRLHRTA